jgi:hypothetical protein
VDVLSVLGVELGVQLQGLLVVLLSQLAVLLVEPGYYLVLQVDLLLLLLELLLGFPQFG